MGQWKSNILHTQTLYCTQGMKKNKFSVLFTKGEGATVSLSLSERVSLEMCKSLE